MEEYIEIDSSELEVGDFIKRTDGYSSDDMYGEVIAIEGEDIDILLSEDYDSDNAGEIYLASLDIGNWYRKIDSKHPRIKTKFLEGFQL